MFDPYHKWLGIAKDQRPPTHYQLLAIPPGETDPEVIEEAAVRQSAHVRTYQIGPHMAECTRLLGEIAQAKLVLLHPGKRQAYDQQLAQARAEQVRVTAPPARIVERHAEFRIFDDDAPGIAPVGASAARVKSIAKSGQFKAAVLWVAVSVSVVGLLAAIVVVVNARRADDAKSGVEIKKDQPRNVQQFVKGPVRDNVRDDPAPSADKAPLIPADATAIRGPIAALVPNPLPQPPPPPDALGKPALDLIPLIDPVRDAVHGKWAIAKGVLHCNDRHFVPRVEIPYQPPEEYDFTVVFSQAELRNGISLIMPNPRGDSFFWHLGSVQGSRYGFFAKVDEGASIAGLITASQVHTTTVKVRRDRVKGLVNGKVLVDLATDFRDLTCDRWRKIRDASVLALACDDPTVFHYVRLVEITGAGKKVR